MTKPPRFVSVNRENNEVVIRLDKRSTIAKLCFTPEEARNLAHDLLFYAGDMSSRIELRDALFAHPPRLNTETTH